MSDWSNFFLGELGAAAALSGLLFVAVSVNQARILELGRMADRGLEALVILFMALIVASLALVPGQPIQVLGGEVLLVGAVTLFALVPLQQGYLRPLELRYRRRSAQMVWINRMAMAVVALGGAVLLWRGDGAGVYGLALGIVLCFAAAGANAWVLLIEINR